MIPHKEKEFLEVLRQNTLIIKKVCCLYSNSREDSKDLEQEISLQLWRSYSTFQGRSKVSTWLYKVALNTAITFLKKEKKHSEKNACSEFYELTTNTNDEVILEQMAEMHKAINKLSKIEKALVMLYIDEKSYDEISDILGISAGNARVKLLRIKEKLKQTVKN